MKTERPFYSIGMTQCGIERPFQRWQRIMYWMTMMYWKNGRCHRPHLRRKHDRPVWWQKSKITTQKRPLRVVANLLPVWWQIQR